MSEQSFPATTESNETPLTIEKVKAALDYFASLRNTPILAPPVVAQAAQQAAQNPWSPRAHMKTQWSYTPHRKARTVGVFLVERSLWPDVLSLLKEAGFTDTYAHVESANTHVVVKGHHPKLPPVTEGAPIPAYEISIGITADRCWDGSFSFKTIPQSVIDAALNPTDTASDGLAYRVEASKRTVASVDSFGRTFIVAVPAKP